MDAFQSQQKMEPDCQDNGAPSHVSDQGSVGTRCPLCCEDGGLDLLTSVFQMLENKESPIYRQEPRFVKALEFYAMDAQTPMPPIEPISVFSPLHSTDLRIILGEENAHFAQLVDSLTQMELDALLSFVDFLNLEKLRD
ncbi:expressed unknown protein [Seminavis robusta]|uniref:Uncharacterized protein n=1 Tax=Seminavis robusta TaxID=568900 RepID=A0A9N8D8I8_9STRA|nr:expressed unknown protein [Seminavis robusta]|eukprot:Sro1_g001030.1 n/a (139) ;mRNA; f:311376-311792